MTTRCLHFGGQKLAAMAEDLCNYLDSVPWPTVVFVSKRSNENIAIHKFRTNDPEVDRCRKSKKFLEVGTFDNRIALNDLLEQLVEAMGMVR